MLTFHRPYKRSLLYTMETKLSSVVDKSKPVGADDHLKVYSLDDLIISVWKVIVMIKTFYSHTGISLAGPEMGFGS